MATFIAVIALIGCSGQPSPTSEPTTPSVPAIPDLWRTVTTDDRDLTLVVPPDLIVTNTSGGISGFRDKIGDAPAVIVSAAAPARVNQPAPGESLTDWVRRESLTAGRGEFDALTQREILLPAGPALEITAGWTLDRQEHWTLLHVIDTGFGFAVLAFDGNGPPPDGPSEEVRLMRELATFEP
jgi:hypothetical protein